MNNNVIEVDNISMQFNLYKESVDNIKEYAVRLLKRKLSKEAFWALKNVSFSVKRGESLAIVGENGSGKSTLLKLLAGVMKPTIGKIVTYGSIAPLIELGAGFDMDLTARENIFLNGAVFGYSKIEMKEVFGEIVDFSELEEFIDVPIKNFSSGMMARLGFSVATITTPDILIVDEILSVGDFKFKKKCEERIRKMILDGTTVLFVSHSFDQVTKICHKAIWLDHGCVKLEGNVEKICNEYKKS